MTPAPELLSGVLSGGERKELVAVLIGDLFRLGRDIGYSDGETLAQIREWQAALNPSAEIG